MFKNLLVYRVAPGWDQTVEGMEAGLQALPFVECGAGMEKSAGWVPPRGEPHGPLVESVGGQRILKLMTEVKLLPASVVARKAKERAQKIEAATGRKPGKKETRDLKEDIRHELLPQAFTKQGGIWVWIDPVAKRLMIDAGSPKKADEVVTLLVQCLQGFAVTLVNTSTSPAVAMGRWLTTQEPPQAFSVDRECELKAADESKAVVRYARHPLDIDEVRQHIADAAVAGAVARAGPASWGALYLWRRMSSAVRWAAASWSGWATGGMLLWKSGLLHRPLFVKPCRAVGAI